MYNIHDKHYWAKITKQIDDAGAKRDEEHNQHPIFYQWKLKKCERCGGDMLRNYNTVFDVEECLQCGNAIYTFGTEGEICYGLGQFVDPLNTDFLEPVPYMSFERKLDNKSYTKEHGKKLKELEKIIPIVEELMLKERV